MRPNKLARTVSALVVCLACVSPSFAQETALELRAKIKQLEKEVEDLQRELDAARREVARLKGNGQTAEATDTSSAVLPPATSDAGVSGRPRVDDGVPRIMVKIPERKISALGSVRASHAKLASVAATNARLQLKMSMGDPERPRILVDPEATGTSITLSLESHRRGKTAVARLDIEDGSLDFAWLAFSPGDLGDGLKALDGALRTALIEIVADGKTVARCQVEPDKIGLRLAKAEASRRETRLAVVTADMQLRGVSVGEGWTVRGDGTAQLVFSREGTEVTLKLNGEKGTLDAASNGLNAASRQVSAIDEQIREWEDQIKSLSDVDARLPDHVVQANRDTIARARQHIASLKAEKRGLVSKASRDAGDAEATLKKCTASIEGDTGVTLYRIVFE